MGSMRRFLATVMGMSILVALHPWFWFWRPTRASLPPRLTEPLITPRFDEDAIRRDDHDATPHHHRRPFPRWEDDAGIRIEPLLQFVHGLRNRSATVTTVHQAKPRSRFPETLYVVDRHGVWTSRTLRRRTWKQMLVGRVNPTETLLQRAWTLLVNTTITTKTTMPTKATDDEDMSNAHRRWTRLHDVVLRGNGFFFLAWYGDYKSCNWRNWSNHSIPLLTTCAAVQCTHAFPIPNYQTILDSQATSRDWDAEWNKTRTNDYAWESKRRQIVWRGSLSSSSSSSSTAHDPLQDQPSGGVRWQLCERFHAHAWFDVGLVSIPRRHKHLQVNLSHVGGLLPHMPMMDFQRYLAVLDVDGNSWSSRFGALLCSNSVVVKVQPDHVDYFYPHLVPWKHYVPVSSDLRDLMHVAAWILDPNNDARLRAIVAQANAWCQTHMMHTALAQDLVQVWETYIGHLDRASNDHDNDDNGGQNWTTLWNKAKPSIFNGDFAMTLLSS